MNVFLATVSVSDVHAMYSRAFLFVLVVHCTPLVICRQAQTCSGLLLMFNRIFVTAEYVIYIYIYETENKYAYRSSTLVFHGSSFLHRTSTLLPIPKPFSKVARVINGWPLIAFQHSRHEMLALKMIWVH